MKLYKSNSKGIYLDITEIELQHLLQIVNQLHERFNDLRLTMQEAIAAHEPDTSLPWRQALAELDREGPAMLTRTLEGSEFATYLDVIQEVKRRQQEQMELQRRQQEQIEESKRKQLHVPIGLTVERNPKA